jgi:hypothetical protein
MSTVQKLAKQASERDKKTQKEEKTLSKNHKSYVTNAPVPSRQDTNFKNTRSVSFCFVEKPIFFACCEANSFEERKLVLRQAGQLLRKLKARLRNRQVRVRARLVLQATGRSFVLDAELLEVLLCCLRCFVSIYQPFYTLGQGNFCAGCGVKS